MLHSAMRDYHMNSDALDLVFIYEKYEFLDKTVTFDWIVTEIYWI